MPLRFLGSEFRLPGFGFRVVGFVLTCHTDFWVRDCAISRDGRSAGVVSFGV